MFKVVSMYKECVQDKEIHTKYPQWVNYVDTTYWGIREKWCIIYRSEFIRGHHTNNFAEAAIRIFKDAVLSRVKAYNVISLIGFTCVVLEDYYKKKCRGFANFWNRKVYVFFKRILKKANYCTKDDISQIDDDVFLVPS